MITAPSSEHEEIKTATVPRSTAQESIQSWLSLEQGSVTSENKDGRWSKRRLALFILATCGLFWLLVGLAIYYLH